MKHKSYDENSSTEYNRQQFFKTANIEDKLRIIIRCNNRLRMLDGFSSTDTFADLKQRVEDVEGIYKDLVVVNYRNMPIKDEVVLKDKLEDLSTVDVCQNQLGHSTKL